MSEDSAPQVDDVWQGRGGDYVITRVVNDQAYGRLRGVGHETKLSIGRKGADYWKLVSRPGTEDTFPPQVDDIWEIERFEGPGTRYRILRTNNDKNEDGPYICMRVDDGAVISFAITTGGNKKYWRLIDRKL